MKKIAIITALLLLPFFVKAQIAFSTVVPLQPVVAGTSFHFKPPVFENFRIVTGPNIYNGTTASITGLKRIRNIVYTLEATRPGKFLIRGAAVTINNRNYESNNVFLIVISEKEAIRFARHEKGNSISNYFLRPWEDPYKKIRENLFLGAINAGIDQIHVNHLTNEPLSINGKLPTHTIYSLKELERIF